MANTETPNRASALVASANVVGVSLQVGYPWRGDDANARTPVNLRAVAWPDGRRIDLKWTNPAGVARVLIKRSASHHSALVTDATSVLYNGGPIEHFIDGVIVSETYGATALAQVPARLDIGVPSSGAELAEDTFYYYTVYLTVADEPVGLLDFGPDARADSQVTGLSITRYFAQPNDSRYSGNWMYRMFAGRAVEADQEQARTTGRGIGFFEGFCRFVQAGVDLERGYVKALERVGNPSRAPAGLVGFAADQASILSVWVRRWGLVPERRLLDVSVLRRLAANMQFLVKEKGSLAGLVDFTKVLTTWDATSEAYGATCSGLFGTWDGVVRRSTYSFQASTVTVSAGSVLVPADLWEPGALVGAEFFGPMGDRYNITGNDIGTLTLDTVETPRVEDLLTISAVVSLGGGLYTLAVSRTAGGPAGLNHNEYAGYQIVTAANSLMDVVSTPSMVDPDVITVESSVLPLAGNAAVAPSYLLGANFAARDPQFLFRVYDGCVSTTWEPRYDETLDVLPNFRTYGGGSLFGLAASPGDAIVTIAEGVALVVGEATSVSGNVLTDTLADFGEDDSLVNRYLNPNRNQTGVFRIVSNTSTTITTEPMAVGGIQLADVARDGSSYFALDLLAKRRYESLCNLLPNFCATQVFVFFA